MKSESSLCGGGLLVRGTKKTILQQSYELTDQCNEKSDLLFAMKFKTSLDQISGISESIKQ